MNREQIEKAALLCAGAGEYGECPYNPDAKNGFIAGADWRINTVWHDVEEKPNGMFVIIIDFGDEVGAEEYGLGVTADDLNGAKRWAYVSDLLPERKEARNDTRNDDIRS